MARAATAFVEFDGDFSKIQRGAGAQANGLESTFKSSFSRIAKFAKLALIGVGGGIAALGVFGIKAAGDFQQTRIAFEGILGSAKKAQTFLEGLRKFAAKTPFEFPELADAAKQLLAVGFNAKDVIPVMTRLGNVAATLGVGGEAIQGVVRALGQMKGKGKASVEELNQISEQIPGFSAVKAIAESLGITTAEAFKKMESGAIDADTAVDAILKGMEKFPGAAGAMGRQSKTLNGVISTFKDTMRDALINGLEPLLPTLSTLVEKAAPLFGKLIGAGARGIAGFVKTIQTLAPLIRDAFRAGFAGGSIAPIHGWLAIFAKVGAALRGLIDLIRGDVASAGVQLGKLFGLEEDDPRVKSMIKALGSIRKALVAVAQFIQKNWKPILIAGAAALLLFVAPVATAVAGLAFLYLRFQLVRDIVQSVADGVQAAGQAIRGVIDAVVGFFQAHAKDFEAFGKQFADIGKAFVGVWEALVPLVRGALTIVIAVIVAAVIVIMALWDRFGQTILNSLRIAFNAIAQVVRGALQIVQGVIEIVTGIITLKWDKVWNGLKNVFGGVWLAMGGIVKFALNQIFTIISFGASAIAAVWFTAWHGFVDVVAGIWGGIERTIGSAVNHIIDIINGLIGAFNALPFAGNIDKIGHVSWGESGPKGATMGIGPGGVPNSLRPLRPRPGDPDFIGPVIPVKTKPPPPGINIHTEIGVVNGVEDLDRHLNERDRKLALALAAG